MGDGEVAEEGILGVDRSEGDDGLEAGGDLEERSEKGQEW